MAFPSSPVNLQTTVVNNITYQYSSANAAWTRIAANGGIRSISTSTAPSNPIIGDIWYKTTTDTMFRYTSDGTNSYWLDIAGPTVSNTTSSATSKTSTSVFGYLLIFGG